MAVTVGEFREFLSDSASSMADAQGGRILGRTMQSVFRRLSREGAWGDKRVRRLILLPPRKLSQNATVTQDSATVTLDPAQPGAFPLERRFYDEKWNIQFDGRETVYQFAEPPSPNSLRLTVPYNGPSTSVGLFSSLSLTKSRFKMPSAFTRVYGVDLPQEGVNALSYLSRSDFESYRSGLLTSASQPWVYTLHNQDEIEFWPPANSDRGFTAEVDVQEALRTPALDADDEDELDWPDHMTDLLWAAGRLQLASELGADAVQFDPSTAQSDYTKTLAIYKTEDSTRGAKVWSMSGGDGPSGTPRPFGLNLRGPVVGEG